jgi:hypothetical protein
MWAEPTTIPEPTLLNVLLQTANKLGISKKKKKRTVRYFTTIPERSQLWKETVISVGSALTLQLGAVTECSWGYKYGDLACPQMTRQ